jgi:hypothetical protein
MFIREDSITDMVSKMSLNELTPQLADILTDETARLNIFNFSGTLVQYQENIRAWYDTVSFLIGL